MCNCSTALYITLTPVLFAVSTFIIAVIVIHFKELADNRRRRIHNQAEGITRNMLYFCVHTGLTKKDSIYSTSIDKFVKTNNKRTTVIELNRKNNEE